MHAQLTKEELLVELANNSGLIPIEIDLNDSNITWMDLESYHCYEGFFHKSLDTFIALKSLHGKTPLIFRTNLHVLEDEGILKDYIYPTGFIFHPGRCGSTLLAKVLAKSRDNFVLSEANAHNQILVSKDKNKSLFKNLVLAMGRKRVATHKYHFIKFTSFNILHFDFIKSVFPDVPAIYIYREPMRILSSISNNPTGWLTLEDFELKEQFSGISANEINSFNQTEYAAKVLINFFSMAFNAKTKGLNYLNYNQLSPSNLPKILESFNVNFSAEQIEMMQTVFNFDSKVEHKKHTYLTDVSTGKNMQIEIDDSLKTALRKLYQQFDESDLNVIKNSVR